MAVLDLTRPTALGLEQRVVGAALRCIARWGVGKTTLDDVAREAGCSRATVYRVFPGGKEGLVDAVVRTEVIRFFTELADVLEPLDDLEELLVTGICHAGRWLAEHRALQYMLANEPEVILPRVAFNHLDDVLRVASSFAAPYLARHIGPDDAPRAAEWLARIVLSYTCAPGQWVDVRDEDSIRRLVRAYVLPGLEPNVRQP